MRAGVPAEPFSNSFLGGIKQGGVGHSFSGLQKISSWLEYLYDNGSDVFLSPCTWATLWCDCSQELKCTSSPLGQQLAFGQCDRYKVMQRLASACPLGLALLPLGSICHWLSNSRLVGCRGRTLCRGQSGQPYGGPRQAVKLHHEQSGMFLCPFSLLFLSNGYSAKFKKCLVSFLNEITFLISCW